MIVRAKDRLEPAAPSRPSEPDLLIDTSKMSKGKAKALEVAEAARDTASTRGGFAAEMLLGRLHFQTLIPFPEQSEQDRAIGDQLVSAVTSFLEANLDPEEVDHTRSIPASVVAGLQGLGVFRMKIPTEYGGLGLSQVNYNRVMMAIASYCGSTAVLVSAHQSIGVPQPLKMFGTPEQKEKYLRMISNGAITAFALTEPNVGSDPARMETTARLSDDGTHFVLSGIKQWTTNGPIADLLVVMARTISGPESASARPRITAFVVETCWDGVENTHRCDFMGLRGIQNGIIRFTNVKVPVSNIIWGEGLGLKLALQTLNTGRLTLPAACAGMGKQCLSIARRWGRDREQWGQPIGKHEAGADKIADIASHTFAMEAVTWLTSHWADQGRDIRLEAAMAKLFTSETAWRIVDETMQLRGGRGYERADSLRARGEDPYPVERMMRDARINTIIEGTSEIMRLYLAREALDPHLRLAAALLKRGSPLPSKLATVARMLVYYSAWYPARTLGTIVSPPARLPGKLSAHIRFANRASNRLARSLFHAMARHGPKLERQQLLLAAQMDIATELFAMSATCAYAQMLGRDTADHAGALDLADQFCQRATIRIRRHFLAARRSPHLTPTRLARRVLSGEMLWLEAGIIPAPSQPAREGAQASAEGY